MSGVKLTKAKFEIGDEVVRISGGEWFGLREGDHGVVTEVRATPNNWHQICIDGYSGLYSDFNFRAALSTNPTGGE